MENYNMCKLSAELYGLCGNFQFRYQLPMPMNIKVVLGVVKEEIGLKHLPVKSAPKLF